MSKKAGDILSSVRRIDELGRIVLPMDIRKRLGINTYDSLEIMSDDSIITIKKAENKCIFCGSKKDLTELNGKHVCAVCVRALSENAEKGE